MLFPYIGNARLQNFCTCRDISLRFATMKHYCNNNIERFFSRSIFRVCGYYTCTPTWHLCSPSGNEELHFQLIPHVWVWFHVEQTHCNWCQLDWSAHSFYVKINEVVLYTLILCTMNMFCTKTTLLPYFTKFTCVHPILRFIRVVILTVRLLHVNTVHTV